MSDEAQKPWMREILEEAEDCVKRRGVGMAYAIARQYRSLNSPERNRYVLAALQVYADDMRWRARKAEGDLASLRGDIAAAYHGTHGDEWTWGDLVRSWGIEESEALSDPDDPTWDRPHEEDPRRGEGLS